MGTNYYTIPTISNDEKLNLIELIIKDKFDEISNLLPSKVHIGKSSMGWQFLFNDNHYNHYLGTRESIHQYLKDNTIIDEYGKIISISKFWEMVESKKKGEISQDHDYSSDSLRFSNSRDFS